MGLIATADEQPGRLVRRLGALVVAADCQGCSRRSQRCQGCELWSAKLPRHVLGYPRCVSGDLGPEGGRSRFGEVGEDVGRVRQRTGVKELSRGPAKPLD